MDQAATRTTSATTRRSSSRRLVLGTGVPPAEVTVEYRQAGVLLESVRMRPAIDTDFEAECYLFPYPVNQELLQVRAEWQDSVAENKDDNPQGEEGTDLGFLKSALARLRTRCSGTWLPGEYVGQRRSD